jgi:hypothetical protein
VAKESLAQGQEKNDTKLPSAFRISVSLSKMSFHFTLEARISFSLFGSIEIRGESGEENYLTQ